MKAKTQGYARVKGQRRVRALCVRVLGRVVSLAFRLLGRVLALWFNEHRTLTASAQVNITKRPSRLDRLLYRRLLPLIKAVCTKPMKWSGRTLVRLQRIRDNARR